MFIENTYYKVENLVQEIPTKLFLASRAYY